MLGNSSKRRHFAFTFPKVSIGGSQLGSDFVHSDAAQSPNPALGGDASQSPPTSGEHSNFGRSRVRVGDLPSSGVMSEQNMDTQIKGGKTGGGADGFRVSVGDLQSRRILQEEQGISNETSTPTSTPTTIFPISCDFDKVYDQADTRGVQQNRTLCGFTNGAGDTRSWLRQRGSTVSRAHFGSGMLRH